jgi:uncharacterized protein YhdP
LGSGSWTATDRAGRAGGRDELCRVQLEGQSTDVAATLAALSLAPALQARKGSAKVDVRWADGVDAALFERLNGRISLRAENGQIPDVEPGAGRALGLLSFAALQRRLTLDFSDLTRKVLAFDTVRGDFDLRDGSAFTQNLVLKGPAAEVGLVGRTGLRERDYDQTVKVTGNLGGTLVAAGTLAGGPAVGAAMLVFSRVFKEPLSGISRGYYRITGSWDKPDVQRIDANQAKQIDQAREAVPPPAPAPAPASANANEGGPP